MALPTSRLSADDPLSLFQPRSGPSSSSDPDQAETPVHNASFSILLRDHGLQILFPAHQRRRIVNVDVGRVTFGPRLVANHYNLLLSNAIQPSNQLGRGEASSEPHPSPPKRFSGFGACLCSSPEPLFSRSRLAEYLPAISAS